jgi:flagella basal body P-ring formation protein FlgA
VKPKFHLTLKPRARFEALVLISAGLILSSSFGLSAFGKASSRLHALDQALSRELSGRYPGATVEWTADPILNEQSPSPSQRTVGGSSASSEEWIVEEASEPSPGVLRFTAKTPRGARVSGSLGFKALVPAWIVTRRVMPGEALRGEDAMVRNLDVTSGLAHESRALLLSAETRIEGLEARQTLVEGGMLTTASVRKAADLRKGEPVKIRLLSGALELSSQGIAEDSARHGDSVRVQVSKTKRILVGRLQEDGSVEVRL